MNVTIYALVDPRTDQVRYVGQSENVKKRYAQHLAGRWDSNHEKMEWIQELRREGMEPQLRILETTDLMEADKSERRHIQSFIDQNIKLLNICNGGRGRARTRAAHATPGEWIKFGNQIKHVREEILLAMEMSLAILGADGYDKLREVMEKLDRVKSRFEGVLYTHRRNWPDVTRVFYGEPLEDPSSPLPLPSPERGSR